MNWTVNIAEKPFKYIHNIYTKKYHYCSYFPLHERERERVSEREWERENRNNTIIACKKGVKTTHDECKGRRWIKQEAEKEETNTVLKVAWE